jgi:hypothetical protein
MNDRDTAGYDEIEPTGLNPAQPFDNTRPVAARAQVPGGDERSHDPLADYPHAGDCRPIEVDAG